MDFDLFVKQEQTLAWILISHNCFDFFVKNNISNFFFGFLPKLLLHLRLPPFVIPMVLLGALPTLNPVCCMVVAYPLPPPRVPWFFLALLPYRPSLWGASCVAVRCSPSRDPMGDPKASDSRPAQPLPRVNSDRSWSRAYAIESQGLSGRIIVTWDLGVATVDVFHRSS